MSEKQAQTHTPKHLEIGHGNKQDNTVQTKDLVSSALLSKPRPAPVKHKSKSFNRSDSLSTQTRRRSISPRAKSTREKTYLGAAEEPTPQVGALAGNIDFEDIIKPEHSFNSAEEILEAIAKIDNNLDRLHNCFTKLHNTHKDIISSISSETKQEIYDQLEQQTSPIFDRLKKNNQDIKVISNFCKHQMKRFLPQRTSRQSAQELKSRPQSSGSLSSLSSTSDKKPTDRSRETVDTIESLSSANHDQISESSLQKLYNVCQRSELLDANDRMIMKVTFSDLPPGLSTRQISIDETGNPLIFDKKGAPVEESDLHITELNQQAEKILDLFDLMKPGTSVNILKKNVNNTITVNLETLKPGIVDTMIKELSEQQSRARKI